MTSHLLRLIETDNDIRWLFNNRCVGIGGPCYDLARDISHIRGRVIDDTWKNKVLHCVKHHTEWHNKGVSEFDIETLQERRKQYLEAIGRSEYI